MTPKDPTPGRKPRGYPIAEVCARENISRRTAWRWIEKGVLKISRVGPRTGVRVQYVDPRDDDPK
jgi:predicted site-specific integrase-resolvase